MFAAEENVNSRAAYTSAQGGYCALITFTPEHSILAAHHHGFYTRKSQFVSDFNEIAAGSDCLHDYCGSSDTFHFIYYSLGG